MNTKKKKDAKYYIERAINDFKTLVIYFDVTRPQYENAYKVDGKFSIEEFKKQIALLNKWNAMTRSEKSRLRNLYNKYSSTSNYTFGIPSELVKLVLDRFRDENGKWHRISVEGVVNHLVKENFIKVVNDGKKFKKNEDNTYSVKCWWKKKYLIANEKYWYTLIEDKRYGDIDTFPNASDRVKKIIMNWRKSQFPQKVDVDEKPKVEYSPAQLQWMKLDKVAQNNIHDLIHEFETGRLDIGGLQLMLAAFNLGRELNAYLEKRAYQRKREWDSKQETR